MAVFDQRNSNINSQYNISGDMYIQNVNNKQRIEKELENVMKELLLIRGEIDGNVAQKVESCLQEASIEVKKDVPNKKSIFNCLGKTKELLQGVTSVTNLVNALTKAAEVVNTIF